MNTANNTFTGKTIIQGGTVLTGGAAYLSNAGSPGVFGAPPAGLDATIDLHNGVTLQSNGSSPRVNQSTDRPLNLAGTGAGTVSIRYGDNDAGLTFGAVTATGTGPKTLALYTGNTGSGDREAIIFTGAIADSSTDGSPTSLNVTFNTQGSPNWVSLSGVNTFTGPITLSQINGTANGVLVVGGVRAPQSGANTIGTGKLGNGNYPGAISLAARTVLEYDSTAAQTLAGAISGVGALQLTGSGTVTLSGANTYSGNTTVNSGCSLVLDPAGSMNFVLGNATNNKITGAGTATLNGSFTIDTSAVTVYTGSWTLADITTKNYGGTFGVTGFTGPVGTVFTKVDGVSRTWTFDTSTSVLTVASPGLITAFSVSLSGGSASVIDHVAKTIHMSVPSGTALNSLAPTYTLSSGTCDHDNGITAYDFTSPVTYQVTAGATVNNYVVTVSTTPVPLLGLKVWLKADAINNADTAQVDVSGKIVKWMDQSGNGNNATPLTSSQPAPTYLASTLNGQPVLRFTQTGDGTGSRLYLGDLSAQFSVAASGSSVFAAATIGTPATPTDGRYNLFGNRANDDRWVANTWVESSPGSFRGGRTSLPYASVPQTGSHIFSMESSSSAYRAVIDGTQIGSVGGDYNSGSGANWNIGNSAAGNGQQLNGDIPELILYNRVLSTAEANAVGYYLATKYGVSSKYVNPNPTAPENLQAIAGDAQVSLTWTTYLGATSYNVKRSATPGGPYSLVGTPTETSFTDSPLANGTPYYYVVSAVASSESPDSTEASATPTGVNATLSTVVTSPPTLWADGIDSSTITVTLVNSSSTPVANKIVSLAQTTGSGATITTVTGTTGADGKAIFTVASTTIGTAVFTATDVTDSNLEITQTATVSFADPASLLAINVNFTGGTAETQSALSGPAGGLGTTWNQFMGPNSPGVVLDAIGPATTVTLTSNFGMPDTFDQTVIDLPMLRGSMSNFGKGVDDTNVTINGLKAGRFYDIWLVTLRNQPYGSDGTEQYVGWWSTINATTSPNNQLVDAVGPTINTTTFVAGYNYVLFQNVKANGSGQIVFTGVAGHLLDGSDNNHRHGLNGLQIKELPPSGTVISIF